VSLTSPQQVGNIPIRGITGKRVEWILGICVDGLVSFSLLLHFVVLCIIFCAAFGLMEFAGVDKAARSKMGVWKMQEWTIRHHVAGMDFAGVE